jgi:hypothetical protein
MAKTTLTKTRVLLTAVAAAVTLLALGAGGAAAAHDASQATANCWLQVINDWENNNRVDNVYAPPCYTQAIQHLSAYPDITGYSSAIDDIRSALYAVLHEEGRGGGVPISTTTTDSKDNKHITGFTGPGDKGGGGGGGGGGPVHWLSNRLAPGSAQSVPLPLLVLGGLALLLLLAAAATWFARRMQARRVTPAPAPATTPPRRP